MTELRAIERQRLGEILGLLARSRGDEDAWTELYKGLWPFVFGSVYRFLRGHRELADDASQEVFYRIVRYYDFDRVKDPDAFLGYLYVVCRNVARDVLTRLIEQRQVLSLAEREGLAATDVDPLTPEEAAHMRQLLDDILGNLDEKSKKLTELLLKGYGLREVAQRLGVTYANAAVRVHRLRSELRKYLKDKGIIRSLP